jgi:hypothetical protein
VQDFNLMIPYHPFHIFFTALDFIIPSLEEVQVAHCVFSNRVFQ